MILIAHRGNINGPNPDLENKPSYIDEALNKGYSAEVDVWYDKGWWLGHDKPQYKLSQKTMRFESSRLIFHAKNSEALSRLTKVPSFHSFWHQEDDYTLTSWGLIWVYPGKRLLKESVCVLPERVLGLDNKRLKICSGVCSDFIERYK